MNLGTTWDVAVLVLGRSAPAADDLVRKGAEGDHGALVVLYRQHFAAVHALAQRLLGSAMAADDLTHEVFEDLPRALRRFRGQGTLNSYLLSITIRLARSHVRAARRRRALEARAAQSDPVELRGPVDVRERQQLAELLVRAMDELTHAQRAAFTLCEVEERSSVEAGEILGKRSGAIRALVVQAKRKLRAFLEVHAAPDLLERPGGGAP